MTIKADRDVLKSISAYQLVEIITWIAEQDLMIIHYETKDVHSYFSLLTQFELDIKK